MSNARERLVTAQWIFERHLGWIAAAEIKVGVVLAMNTAMLGGLAAAFGTALVHTTWAVVLTILAAGTSSAAVFCAAMAVMPRLAGPTKSLLFFGRIKELSAAEYIQKLANSTDEQLLADWAEQIHRNAEIACDKHAWVRKAMGWSFLASAPWLAAVFVLAKI
jgi:hypothetical protein